MAKLARLFSEYIVYGMLVHFDSLKSYRSLAVVAGCTMKDCHELIEEEKCFFNLNTVDGFHSFIKRRYDFYCGVATKYLNQYNTLFTSSYNNAADMIKCLYHVLLNAESINHYHSARNVRKMRLLAF